MPLSTIDYLLWAAGPILLGLTCWGLLKRRLVRDFPVFFAYAAFHVVRSTALVAIHLLRLQHRMSYADYFYAYWIGQAISIALGFAVIYEIYRRAFKNYDAIRQLGGMLFGFAAVVLLGVAVLTAAAASGSDAQGIVKSVVLLERSVRVMQAGLLGFLFLLSFYFGLRWQNYLFGIALGFGVFASIELVAVTLRAQLGIIAATRYSQIGSAAYDCGVLIWVCYLLAPQVARKYVSVLPRTELEKWNEALVQILKP